MSAPDTKSDKMAVDPELFTRGWIFIRGVPSMKF
ncbi:MAG: YihA family ribosome biogenesis GTP-binding protein, partial [Mesorhizobium sp.]